MSENDLDSDSSKLLQKKCLVICLIVNFKPTVWAKVAQH